MKLFIQALLFVMALILVSCGDVLSTAQMASAVQTLTATVLPPTPTVTPDPDESAIVMLLNRGLEQTADPLSQTVDARYQVVDASFPLGANQLAATFRIDVRCECVGSACCTPERTFVVIVAAMKPGMEKIARQVPVTVMDVQVVCLDHTTPIGMMIVAWRDLTGYFTGAINGFQLGARAIRLAGP
ncbi:MAG: hypothetical protein AB1750_09215 [Chloroflexota bacterium]